MAHFGYFYALFSVHVPIFAGNRLNMSDRTRPIAILFRSSLYIILLKESYSNLALLFKLLAARSRTSKDGRQLTL